MTATLIPWRDVRFRGHNAPSGPSDQRRRSLLARVRKGEHMRSARPVTESVPHALTRDEIDWTGFRRVPSKSGPRTPEGELRTVQFKLRVSRELKARLDLDGTRSGRSAQQVAIAILERELA